MNLIRKRLTLQANHFERLCAQARETDISVSMLLTLILNDSFGTNGGHENDNKETKNR